MRLRQGDTFRDAARKYETHLWVVISDPDVFPEDPVVIVSITTWRADKEQVCILGPADHPNISRRSCVFYAGARLVRMEVLQSAFQKRLLTLGKPFSSQVLKRICEGAARSNQIPLECRDLLEEQGII